MKDPITIATTNIFEQKSEEFENSRDYERVRDKYKPESYEQKNKDTYLVAYYASFVCNGYSILSASTFVFLWLVWLFSGIPYAFVPAGILTAVSLFTVEYLQRRRFPLLVKDIYQYGFKAGYSKRMLFILLLSFASVFCSYMGGYDIPEKVTAVPEYVEPELIDIERKTFYYSTIIEAAKNDAESFKKANSYKGRLDFARGQQYAAMLKRSNDHRKEMQTAIKQAETENKQRIETAKAQHAALLAGRSEKVGNYGLAMALGAIAAQFLFFLCIWFTEHYDFKTASQYAVIESAPAVPNPTQQQVVVQGFQQHGQAAQTPVKQVANSKTLTPKQSELKSAKGSLSSYQSRVRKYTKQGKTHLLADNKRMVKFWENKVKELSS